MALKKMQKHLNRLIELQQEIKDGLVTTPAQTLEEYRNRVGKYQGLQVAIDELLHLMRGAEQDE